MKSRTPAAPAPGAPAAWAADLARCLRFYSRLPVPVLPWEGDPHAVPDFRTMPRMLPLAGAVIGAVGAGILLGALALGLGPGLSAALAITALTLATGAFHEDGLADTADGFWGGLTPERRLEIMKDSRIGSYGGAALVLAYALRIGALATLAERVEPGVAAAVLVFAAALSRTAALTVMIRLAPARMAGSSYAVGQPTGATFALAWALCGALGLALALAAGVPAATFPAAAGAALAGSLGMTRLSRRLIAGYTGDVGGATQQVCEIAALIACLAVTRA